MAQFTNRARLQAKMRAITPAVRDAIRPVLSHGADEIKALAVDLVAVEQGKGAHPNRPPGTLKNAIEWHWWGVLGILITDRPKAMTNLGIWVERGTKASGDMVGRLYKRGAKIGSKLFGRFTKAHGPHHATKAEPFFGPAVRAYYNEIKRDIGKASKSAIKRIANGGS